VGDNMVKRTATVAVLLLTLALAAIGSPIYDHRPPCPRKDVPEPGSLLVFGAGLLLSFKALKTKL